MSAHVVVSLDTTAPTLSFNINGGDSSTTEVTVTLNVSAGADAIEAKIWGAIDPTNPLNADYGETPGGAAWIPVEGSYQVVLNPSGGPKTFRVRVRDDVWNERTAVASIYLDREVPAPTEPPYPVPTPQDYPPSGPDRLREQYVQDTSHVLVFTTDAVVRRPGAQRSPVAVRSRDSIGIRHLSRSTVRLEEQTAVATSLSSAAAVVLGTEDEIDIRREGPETEAALLDLGIL